MPKKTCFQCREEKDASQFYKNKAKKDGLQNMCKECTKKNDRNRIDSGVRKEKQRKAYSLRIENEPGFAERERIRKHIWKTKWAVDNPELVKEHRKRQYNLHKDYYIANAHRRRVKEGKVIGYYDQKQLEARFELYGNRCAYCGTSKNLTIDHVISIFNGGTNFPSNLVPAYRKCNCGKRERFVRPRLPKTKMPKGLTG